MQNLDMKSTQNSVNTIFFNFLYNGNTEIYRKLYFFPVKL